MSNVVGFFFLCFERTSTWQIMKTARFMCCRQIMVLFPLQEFRNFFFLQTLKSHSHSCVFAKCALPVSHLACRFSAFFVFRESSRTISGCWNVIKKKQIKQKKNQLNTHWVHVYPNSMVDVNTVTSTTAAPHTSTIASACTHTYTMCRKESDALITSKRS